MKILTRGLTVRETMDALAQAENPDAVCQVLYPKNGRGFDSSPLYDVTLGSSGDCIHFSPFSANSCSDLVEVSGAAAQLRLRQSLEAARDYLVSADFDAAAVALQEAASMATELDEVHGATSD